MCTGGEAPTQISQHKERVGNDSNEARELTLLPGEISAQYGGKTPYSGRGGRGYSPVMALRRHRIFRSSSLRTWCPPSVG
jgi:hypothetical protein